MPPRPWEQNAAAERLRRLVEENQRLRALCYMLLSELRLPALMPGELPSQRLDYMLGCLDPRDVYRRIEKARGYDVT